MMRFAHGPMTYGGPHTTHRTGRLFEEQVAVDGGDVCAAKQREVVVDLFAQNGDSCIVRE